MGVTVSHLSWGVSIVTRLRSSSLLRKLDLVILVSAARLK